MPGTFFQDEDKLITAIIGKNVEAFSCLYDKYAPALNGMIMHATNNDLKNSEMLLYDYFTWLWNHFQPAKGRPLFAWLILGLNHFMKENGVFEKNDHSVYCYQETQFKKDEAAIPALISLVFKGFTKDEIAIKLRLTAVEINAHFRNAFLDLRNKVLV